MVRVDTARPLTLSSGEALWSGGETFTKIFPEEAGKTPPITENLPENRKPRWRKRGFRMDVGKGLQPVDFGTQPVENFVDGSQTVD